MGQLETTLRKRGLKVTGQRRLVLSVLEEAKDHPTAQEIHRRAIKQQRISLGTVYRILNKLAEAGILSKHAFGGVEGRYEPVSGRHHHLVDAKTGRIIEVDDRRLTILLEQIADSCGYRLIDCRLELVGEPKPTGPVFEH